MNTPSFSIVDGAPKTLARAWLWLGLLALIGSGILAILLVLSRTPGLHELVPVKEFFRSALVVHVDLSVAIWFMAFAAAIWSAVGRSGLEWMSRAGFALAAAGTLLMSISPFLPGAEPILNNYIPVLEQPAFFFSLWLCWAGFSLAVLRALVTTYPTSLKNATALQFGAFLGALAGFLSLAAFLWSYLYVPKIDDKLYYEVLFWGGGHTLQFQHALLMVVAWLWIAQDLGQPASVPVRALNVLFLVAALPLVAVPIFYLIVPVGSLPHMELFAELMKRGHPFMGPLILVGFLTLLALAKSPSHPAKSAYVASFVLFAAGGVLGYLIREINVVVPAHYHGNIVGVTLAFMGLTYVLLPHLGFRAVEGKMAAWQAAVYGSGQLIHILGLAWSGGYGVQRKTAGAEQMLTTLPQKIGMGMMGAGGLIAIIGGLMFVIVCLKAMRREK